MEILAWFVAGFAILRLIVSLLNLLPGNLLGQGEVRSDPLVSVLVPARNEETVLGRLLESLRNQSYQNIEILVYDDESADGTLAVAEAFHDKDRRFRTLHGTGTPLPEGWTGKNHACHRLALEARGEYLLFLDADVVLGCAAVGNAVSRFQERKLHLLSVFPRQIMRTTGERLSVPLMNWVLLSMLPLILVRHTELPSLSAANGQFMMFRADSYREHQWHSRVRNHPVEDILIARRVKQAGLPMMTLLGGDGVSCRMYGSYGEALYGFSKNVNQYLGGFTFTLALFSLLILAGWVPVVLAFEPALIAGYFAALTAIRVFSSLAAGESVPTNLLLHPAQLFSWLMITTLWFRNRMKKKYHWKGREIRV